MRFGQHLTSLGVFLGILAIPANLDSVLTENKAIIEIIEEISEVPTVNPKKNLKQPKSGIEIQLENFTYHLKYKDSYAMRNIAKAIDRFYDTVNSAERVCPVHGGHYVVYEDPAFIRGGTTFKNNQLTFPSGEVYPCYENKSQGIYNSQEALTFLDIYYEYDNFGMILSTEHNSELEKAFNFQYMKKLQKNLQSWYEVAETETEKELIATNLETIDTILQSDLTGQFELDLWRLE